MNVLFEIGCRTDLQRKVGDRITIIAGVPFPLNLCVLWKNEKFKICVKILNCEKNKDPMQRD